MNPVTTNCILFVIITYLLTCIIAWSLPPEYVSLLATFVPATVAILLTAYNKQKIQELFKLSSLKNCSLGLAVAVVAFVIYIPLFVLAVKFTQVTEPALTAKEMSDFGVVHTLLFLLINFIVLIITSIGTEIGWRGYLLKNLKSQIPNFYVRSIVVGLILGVWHILLWKVISSDLTQEYKLPFICAFILFYCVTSITYTWLFEKDNSIWPVTIAHATMNFTVPIIVLLLAKTLSLPALTSMEVIGYILHTIAYLIVATGIILFEKTQGRSLSNS